MTGGERPSLDLRELPRLFGAYAVAAFQRFQHGVRDRLCAADGNP